MREDYPAFYRKISAPFRRTPAGRRHLSALNKCLTGLMYCLYPILLIVLFLERDQRFLRVLLVPGISFVLVSLVRRAINRKRPYEKYSIDPLIRKDTKGCSMPSRHVFSSTVIAMCYLWINPPAGAVLLIVSALSAIVRVIIGVHYPSDVAVGFLIGAAAGSLLYL